MHPAHRPPFSLAVQSGAAELRLSRLCLVLRCRVLGLGREQKLTYSSSVRVVWTISGPQCSVFAWPVFTSF